jgi:hypothetical protein
MTPTVVNLQSRFIASFPGGAAWDRDHNRRSGAAPAGVRIEHRRRVAHRARARGLGRLIGVGEHQLAPGLAHVPPDVERQHAQQDVRAHPVSQPVVHGPHLQVPRLEWAERALRRGPGLVAVRNPQIAAALLARPLTGKVLGSGSRIHLASPGRGGTRALKRNAKRWVDRTCVLCQSRASRLRRQRPVPRCSFPSRPPATH